MGGIDVSETFLVMVLFRTDLFVISWSFIFTNMNFLYSEKACTTIFSNDHLYFVCAVGYLNIAYFYFL